MAVLHRKNELAIERVILLPSGWTQDPSLPESITTFCPVTLSLRQKSTTLLNIP
jgi:hypothetical protein